MEADAILKNAYTRYVDLDDASWQHVLSRWQKVDFKKGEFLIEQGQVEPYFYVVVSGVQRLFFDGAHEEHTLGFSYDGSWSGGFASFISGLPSDFSVEALSDSQLWRIAREDYFNLYQEVPVLERWGRLILEELLMQRSIREQEMMSLSAEDRYKKLLERSRHLLQLVPQKHIASYLKMTPETFSRLRRKGL